jgi:hypothetical protein
MPSSVTEQRDAGVLLFVFDLRAEVGEPRDALDRCADHGVEPPVGSRGFGEKVTKPAVTRQRQLQPTAADAEFLRGVRRPEPMS